jgi:hypothetical protein
MATTKLWLLRNKIFSMNAENPWDPWYDKVFGFVISAETEFEARLIANEHAKNENDNNIYPWLDATYSTCVELIPQQKKGIIIRDFRGA